MAEDLAEQRGGLGIEFVETTPANSVLQPFPATLLAPRIEQRRGAVPQLA
jgi:hypothetical protein